MLREFLLIQIKPDHKHREFLVQLHPNRSEMHVLLLPLKAILGVEVRPINELELMTTRADHDRQLKRQKFHLRLLFVAHRLLLQQLAFRMLVIQVQLIQMIRYNLERILDLQLDTNPEVRFETLEA